MAAITHEATAAADHGDVHDDHEDHPTDLLFWKVGGFLAIVTAIEVSTIWWRSWGAPPKITALALIGMMVIKFSVVGLYFMHLKWDAKILRRVFTVGVVLALGVYLAAMSAMVIFDNSGNHVFNDPPRCKPLPPPATDPPPIIKPIAHH